MPDQLLTAPDEIAQPVGGEDRRGPQRYSCELPSACQPASTWGSEEAKWSATIRNISPAGICLTLGRRFERGTGLAIDLPGAAGKNSSTVLGKVVHVQPQADGTWSLGCELISELNDDEIQSLLSSKPKQVLATQTTAKETPQDNQDNSENKTYSQVRCRLEILPGTTIQYIIHQLFVLESWPLPRGKVVTLRGVVAGVAWALKAQVLHCRFRDEIWYLQCRLVNFPSLANLLGALARLDTGS
ncbi:MAG: PilZ domain-containing protein [Planctomycetes bacterium]|nr:PilZ domain-containing protein [Planctomycetota bacterium]